MTTIRLLATPSGRFRVALDGPDDAPALVLSNSLGTPLEMWDAQATAFSGHFRVVRYDIRGHGQSDAPTGPYTIGMLGTDVLSVLDSLGIARADFCGISMGGLTGLWLGAFAGDRIGRLVVANSAARIGSPEGWLARARQVREAGLRELALSAPTRWFTQEFAAAQSEIVASAQRWLLETSLEGYAACCEALASADLRPQLSRISASTLLIAGKQDPVTTVADAQEMAASIPNARLAVIPASHLSNVESPSTFDDLLKAFLLNP